MDSESHQKLKRTWSLRTLAWLTIGAVLAGYLIVIPFVNAFLEQFREQQMIIPATDLDVSELFRIRTAKFLVFAVFTYYGACVASFINVVAKSVPSGASVTTRSSACPACGKPIRRIDNLPLISYLNLEGRCRNCLSTIPIRYFLTEVIGATIFGSLFLFELVTGATNVPEFKRYFYSGILWIILYTKWPVIGIYLYHAALFSCLLMLSLMDLDRLRCPKWLSGFVLCIFAGLSVAIPTLQPVQFHAHLRTDFSNVLSPSMFPFVTCFAGGLIGWLFTSSIRIVCNQRQLDTPSCSTFPLAGALVGIALGWQATVTILLFTTIVLAVICAIKQITKKRLMLSYTVVFSVVAFLHHPLWKWCDSLW